MRLRVSLSGKGLIVLLLTLFSFLLGTSLHVSMLNLCGYFLASTLATALVLGFLEVRGIKIQAVAGSTKDVWVRVVSSRRAGPFGLSVQVGKRWSDDEHVMAPDPAGCRLQLPIEEAPSGPVRVRLRAFPLGLLSVGVQAIADRVESSEQEETRRAPATAVSLSEPFGGVRDHRPGESLRDVHWRASARRPNLLVRIRDQEIEPSARPRIPDRPFEAQKHEQRLLLHVATCVTALFAIGFAWALGTIATPIAMGAAAVQGLGGIVSGRRGGRPGWPLLIVLYLGVLAALGGFLMSLRQPAGTLPAMAGLLVAVTAVFAWDLRNRTYLRAQQLNAFLVFMITPALYPAKHTPLLGVMFAGAAIALLLASWADGRHEIGFGRVSLQDLKDLPTAWLPIGILGLVALLIHPWLPALPLPPLPTFGANFAAQRSRSVEGQLPGQAGSIDLDVRWPQSKEPVIRIHDRKPMRLRTETLATYRGGYWFRSDLKEMTWPSAKTARNLAITLLRGGMTVLPLPEGATGLADTLKHTLYRGLIAETHVPLDKGFTYRVKLSDQPLDDTALPTRSERTTLGLPSGLLNVATRLSGGETSPQKAMVTMAKALQRLAVYDLDAPVAPDGADPTLYFLETSHRGFCIHFASALALLGRELGIPTRLVTGYTIGTRRGDDTEVLACDAHAWVEAYVDGHWQSFDPTPAGVEPRASSDAPRLWTLAVLLVALVALGVWRRPRSLAATRDYQRLLKRLSKRGVPITPASSPQEVLAMATGRVSDSELRDLRELTSRYEAARFAATRAPKG